MNTKIQTAILEIFKFSKIPFLNRSKQSFQYENFNNNSDVISTVFYSRQIAVVTGASGTGKSSLIFYSINELDPSEFRVVGSELSNPNKKALYKTLALKLRLKPAFNADDIKNQIITYFNEENAQGKFNCIIIDEAHTLSIPMFDEIRSFYDEGGNFSLILSGLPPLLNQLNLSVNLPLKQRISLFLECSGLSLAQTKEYIDYQLDMAKCANSIIDEKCFPIIHSLTSGVPRKINQLCYAAIFEAYKLKKSIITEDILKIVEEKLAYAK
ncbi:ExeA family protein [Haloimpatiens sp. FM7330]|uniref:ExeA family protein n=1 Tax=Haloimpatiens sp. FM7330 TaxID=3298610 RepID=UPI00362933E4